MNVFKIPTYILDKSENNNLYIIKQYIMNCSNNYYISIQYFNI